MTPRLNKVKSRGKWYVYLRGERGAVVKGFAGSEEDLDAILGERLAEHSKTAAIDQDRFRKGWRMDMARYLHKVTKARAARRGIAYALSVDTIFKMLEAQQDACSVSGIPFIYSPKADDSEWHRRPFAASVDRRDNRLAYEPDNVRLVTVCVNISINEWGSEVFEKMCEAVVSKRENVLQN